MLTVAEELRSWTEPAMKIEVANTSLTLMIYKEFESCKIIKVSLSKMDLIEEYPWIGNTTLSKKLHGFRLFQIHVIVFMVFLNFMKPEDSIENVIIQQTPALEGMCVRKDKIAGMLETW